MPRNTDPTSSRPSSEKVQANDSSAERPGQTGARREGRPLRYEDVTTQDIVTAEVRFNPIEELVNLHDVEDDPADGDASSRSDDALPQA